MHHSKLLIALLCLGSTSGAIAADPPAPPATQAVPAADAPTSTSAPPASSAPGAATTAPSTTAADKAKALEDQTKRMRKLGYKPQVRNGNTVYCKETEVIGTRFPQMVCSDADTIEQQQRSAQDQLSTPRNSTAPGAK